MNKPRDFYMDTDLLDKALDSCDLGDGYMAKVRQYPHKDYTKNYTHVREVVPDEVHSTQLTTYYIPSIDSCQECQDYWKKIWTTYEAQIKREITRTEEKKEE